MPRKIIEKKKFAWQEEDRFRLNYQMLFEERRPDESKSSEKPDIGELLREQQEKWRVESEQIREKAFDQGLQQGRKEGFETAQADLESRLTPLREQFQQAREEWQQQQELLKPGLLNLVFDISETVLGVPVTNGTMRNKLEEELRNLLQDMDKKARPVLWVSNEDYDLVEELQKEFADTTGVVVRVSNHCNPGEFQLETNREKVVRDFRQMLKDFKESLILPK